MTVPAAVVFLAAALSGAALVLSFAPFDLWPLAFLSAGGFFLLLERLPERALLIAAGFGLVKYGFGLSWVYVSINVYGDASPLLAGCLVLLMASIMTTVTWAQCLLWPKIRPATPVATVLVFAGLWTAGEWIWTWWLSGFPWLFAGYSQLTTPLAGFAPVGGVFLVSFLVALIGAALVRLCQRQWVMLAVILVPLAAGYGIDHIEWTEPAGRQSVALVQGNIEQSVKWDASQRDPNIRTHIRLTAPYWGRVDSVIWPEGAVTYWAHEADFLLDRLESRGRRTDTALVTGIPVAERVDGDVQVYNGVLVVGEGHGRYLKQVLVPFGEYVPFESILRGIIAFFDLPMSGFAEGPADQPLLDLNGVPAVMLICYEVAFPGFVSRQVRDAEVLLTISNDTWFGTSIGPLQHMQIAQMRARETGRWMLRATNNGLTGIINHRGELIATIPRFEAGVLEGSWERRQGSTPFQRSGNVPVLFLVAGLLLGAMYWRRRGTAEPKRPGR